MKEAIKVLNAMVKKGILDDYALGGAIGVMFYTESLHTKDLDVFIMPQIAPGGIVHFGEFFHYLRSLGYKTQGQYVVIDDMLVDFILVYNKLTKEALEKAKVKKYYGVNVKVFRPEYLIAIALQTGRRQDLRKVDMIHEECLIDKVLLNDVLRRYNLKRKWKEHAR